MALEDKDLFRKNSRENINYQIESMNIFRRKYHTNKLNLWFLIRVPKVKSAI